MNKFKRPEVLEGHTIRHNTPCGHFYLTLNEHDGRLCEVRMGIGKSGNCQRLLFETLALLISVMLQSNIPREKIKKTILNQIGGNCGEVSWNDGQKYHSCVDFAVTKILEDMASREEIEIETT